MKVVEGNRASMTFEFEEGAFNGKQIQVDIEILIDGVILYTDSIKYWKEPYERLLIEEKEKNKIVEQIKEWSDSNLIIE